MDGTKNHSNTAAKGLEDSFRKGTIKNNHKKRNLNLDLQILELLSQNIYEPDHAFLAPTGAQEVTLCVFVCM